MNLQAEIARHALKRSSGQLDGDRRRHRRLVIDLSGRFMSPDRTEHACKLRDISIGGAAIRTDERPAVGDTIIAYFEHIGGLTGKVVRYLDDGFAFEFSASEHKREKLAAQLTWLINRDAFPGELQRMHARVGTAGRKTTMKIEDGIVLDVDLLDLSISGASIATPARPMIGSDIAVGGLEAVVRRHHDQGIGVQFVTVLSKEALAAHFP